MDIERKTIWQVAAGHGKDTNYAGLCLEQGVILLGPGKYGPWPDCEQPMRADGWSATKAGMIRRFARVMAQGDMVVLRVGTQHVYGVGVVEGSYGWDARFADVHGQDLQHFRRVQWLWHKNGEPKTYAPHTLKFGSSVQYLISPQVRQWLQGLELK
jgi:hypothetical protein